MYKSLLTTTQPIYNMYCVVMYNKNKEKKIMKQYSVLLQKPVFKYTVQFLVIIKSKNNNKQGNNVYLIKTTKKNYKDKMC